MINVNLAASFLGTTYPTASRLVTGLEELGILREITGRRRSRIYRYEPYVSLFDDPPASEEGADRSGELEAGRLPHAR